MSLLFYIAGLCCSQSDLSIASAYSCRAYNSKVGHAVRTSAVICGLVQAVSQLGTWGKYLES